MPRFNVNHNDKWACYSSVVDNFITDFVPLEAYEQWRQKEYGANVGPVTEANQMSMEEAIRKMIIYHSKYNVLAVLKEQGFITSEILLLVEKFSDEIIKEREAENAI